MGEKKRNLPIYGLTTEKRKKVKKFKLVKLWDWLEYSERNKMKNSPLSKISLLVQFGG